MSNSDLPDLYAIGLAHARGDGGGAPASLDRRSQVEAARTARVGSGETPARLFLTRPKGGFQKKTSGLPFSGAKKGKFVPPSF